MDKVSEIRRTWVRPESKIFNTLVDISPNPWLASTLMRKMAWRIPEWLSTQITPELYMGIKMLVQAMRQCVN
jgi:hypothetical protein